MSVDKDITQFVASIGARAPSPASEDYAKWKAIFRRPNYFFFDNKFMIVKISRSKKPFWGVGKDFIDLFNSLDDYLFVLLISPREGGVFTKSEVKTHVKSGRWKLRETDNNYKINHPLPDGNSFSSPENFLTTVGLSGCVS